ncbi:hypothetical protein AGMMS49546_04670 [Spirochaetia bacterium]|nr:hypothetical protein AGMMS49546_04670 [Spirochaetia bacterium]
MNELEKKTGMTEKEAEYWDDYYTKNPPKVDPAKNRIKMKPPTVVVEGTTAQYLKSASDAEHKTPTEIIRPAGPFDDKK